MSHPNRRPLLVLAEDLAVHPHHRARQRLQLIAPTSLPEPAPAEVTVAEVVEKQAA